MGSKRCHVMRTITLLSTVAAVLSTVVAFAPSAKADRICRQACDQGFCQNECFESDHVYLDNRDKDFYLRHGRPDVLLDR
jgi:hypothetical protein